MGYFDKRTLTFLNGLKRNNNRDWFQAHKEDYEADLKEPFLDFISDAGPQLAKISKFIVADPRPNGGSLFRIYRDVRFSKDKSPYKTYTGIQFRHELGKDAHAPGFYLHLQPNSVFVGAGIWHPDGPALARIREAIADDPKAWSAAKLVGARFELAGDSLKRAPAGYDPEHPLIDDLKRKDFICSASLTEKEVCSRGFVGAFAGMCREASPLVRFLCSALDAPF